MNQQAPLPNQTQTVSQSSVTNPSPTNQLASTQSLYDSSIGSIFWKNFVAGFARALGGMIIWIILILFSGYMFVNLVWPQIHPFLSSYQQLFESFATLQSTPNPSASNPDQVQNILNQPEVQNVLNRLGQPPTQ